MINYIKTGVSKLTSDANKRINYAIELSTINSLKKKKMIDEEMFNKLVRYLKRKYKIKID